MKEFVVYSYHLEQTKKKHLKLNKINKNSLLRFRYITFYRVHYIFHICSLLPYVLLNLIKEK